MGGGGEDDVENHEDEDCDSDGENGDADDFTDDADDGITFPALFNVGLEPSPSHVEIIDYSNL